MPQFLTPTYPATCCTLPARIHWNLPRQSPFKLPLHKIINIKHTHSRLTQHTQSHYTHNTHGSNQLNIVCKKLNLWAALAWAVRKIVLTHIHISAHTITETACRDHPLNRPLVGCGRKCLTPHSYFRSHKNENCLQGPSSEASSRGLWEEVSDPTERLALALGLDPSNLAIYTGIPTTDAWVIVVQTSVKHVAAQL